jgi:acyl-CoA hydrolase
MDTTRPQSASAPHRSRAGDWQAIAGQPDFALGSVHAVTRDGTLVIASASSSQLAGYAWGAANVIFVVGIQKLVPDLDKARERIFEHSLKLEDARALAAYGMNSRIGKILEIHQEDTGRTHIVLVGRSVGY